MPLAAAPFATLDDYNELSPSLCQGLCAEDPTEDQIEEALILASDLLVQASGFTYVGRQLITARPSLTNCSDGVCCADPIVLGSNVTGVQQVKVDGVTLVANTDYRVVTFVGRIELYRMLDGRPSSWPDNQCQWRLPSEDETFEVKFYAGKTPSMIEVAATVEMACFILSGLFGTGDDILRSATSASGGGLTVELDEGSSAEPAFKATTQFLARWNPSKARHPSSFFSPDVAMWALNIRSIEAA